MSTIRTQRADSIASDNRIITECRRMSSYDVAQMCIRHNWYTHGSPKEYDKMLDFVSEHRVEATDLEGLYYIARDIAKHSDLTELGCDPCEASTDAISTIMYALTNEATNLFYSIGDAEDSTATEDYFR